MMKKVRLELEKRWLTTAEALEYLGISKNTLLEMRDKGHIDYGKIDESNSTVWYDRVSIDTFLESRLVNKRIREEMAKNRRTVGR